MKCSGCNKLSLDIDPHKLYRPDWALIDFSRTVMPKIRNFFLRNLHTKRRFSGIQLRCDTSKNTLLQITAQLWNFFFS